MKRELRLLAIIAGIFLFAYLVPFSHPTVHGAIMEALLDEGRKHGLGSTAHLGQMGVAQMNAQDSARLGLGTYRSQLFQEKEIPLGIWPYVAGDRH